MKIGLLQPVLKLLSFGVVCCNSYLEASSGGADPVTREMGMKLMSAGLKAVGDMATELSGGALYDKLFGSSAGPEKLAQNRSLVEVTGEALRRALQSCAGQRTDPGGERLQEAIRNTPERWYRLVTEEVAPQLRDNRDATLITRLGEGSLLDVRQLAELVGALTTAPDRDAPDLDDETLQEMAVALQRELPATFLDVLTDEQSEKVWRQMVMQLLLELRAQVTAAPSQPARLCQLAPPHDFIGRQEEVSELLQAVKKGGVMISGLQGMGGIGKTALALKVAHELQPDYPDGQIFLDLKGVIARDDAGVKQEPLTPAEVMRYVINSFQPTAKLPDSPDSLQALYRSTLAGKRVLLLFDNARDAKQLNPLLPPAGCLLLVTSRQHFHLRGMYDKNLEKLRVEDACRLLLAIEPRIGASAPALAALCDCLPIALRAVASALANTPSLAPGELERRLQNKKKLLRLVDESREITIAAAFDLSYELLSEGLQQRWRMLAVFPDLFFADAAAALWGLPDLDEAKEILEEIERHSLLDWSGETQRYGLHDLARDFAAAKMGDAEMREARRRHAFHYWLELEEAEALYVQGNELVAEGVKRYDLGLRNIQAGHAWAADQAGQDEEAARLCVAYAQSGRYILPLRQHPREYLHWQDTARAAAQRWGDRQPVGKALGNMGNAYYSLGEMAKAIEYYEQALTIARDIGDRKREGNWLGNLGLAHVSQGELKPGIARYEQALAVAREVGDQRAESIWLGNLGGAYLYSGERERAIAYYEQALAVARAIGDRHGEANHFSGLGLAYTNLGEVAKAIAYHERALAIARDIGDRRGEGIVLGNLGLAYAALGEKQKAIALTEQALKIFEEIESPSAAAARLWLEQARGTATES